MVLLRLPGFHFFNEEAFDPHHRRVVAVRDCAPLQVGRTLVIVPRTFGMSREVTFPFSSSRKSCWNRSASQNTYIPLFNAGLPVRLADQGSIYLGTKGLCTHPTSIRPSCCPLTSSGHEAGEASGNDHYIQFVEACRGNGKTSAPFEYSGPLTESVLLGCLATRFPDKTLEWDTGRPGIHQCSRGERFRSAVLSQGLGNSRALSTDVQRKYASRPSTRQVQYIRNPMSLPSSTGLIATMGSNITAIRARNIEWD